MGKANNVVPIRDWWKQPRAAGSMPIVQKKKKLAAQYFPLAEMAARFSVGYDVLYKAIRRGELEFEVVGRSYRVTEEAVEKFLLLCRKKKSV